MQQASCLGMADVSSQPTFSKEGVAEALAAVAHLATSEPRRCRKDRCLERHRRRRDLAAHPKHAVARLQPHLVGTQPENAVLESVPELAPTRQLCRTRDPRSTPP